VYIFNSGVSYIQAQGYEEINDDKDGDEENFEEQIPSVIPFP
jgi:hypothetical protein